MRTEEKHDEEVAKLAERIEINYDNVVTNVKYYNDWRVTGELDIGAYNIEANLFDIYEYKLHSNVRARKKGVNQLMRATEFFQPMYYMTRGILKLDGNKLEEIIQRG